MQTNMMFQDLLDDSRLINPIEEVHHQETVLDSRTGRHAPRIQVRMRCKVFFKHPHLRHLMFAGLVELPQHLFTWEGKEGAGTEERIGFRRVR